MYFLYYIKTKQIIINKKNRKGDVHNKRMILRNVNKMSSLIITGNTSESG